VQPVLLLAAKDFEGWKGEIDTQLKDLTSYEKRKDMNIRLYNPYLISTSGGLCSK
jgi:hypothetical protein